jgi:hypothetical protein
MFSLSCIVRTVYVAALSFALCLLLGPTRSQAQFGAPAFGVSSGYRGTPALPTIAIPVLSGSGAASGVGFGGGFRGGIGGGSVSGSFSTQIIYVNLGSFLPNNGRIIGPPMPTFQPMLNNLFFAGVLFSPFTSDSTGSPFSLLTSMSIMGGMGMGGMRGMMGMGGMGMGGMRGMMGMGGFAGKGLGGFNGRKAL